MLTLTPQIIRAAATDAGNRSMRNAGRRAWSEEDYDAAAETFVQLAAQHFGSTEDFAAAEAA